MKVSIVIDNYNYGHFLAEAIESALSQTWQDLEVVVVDDGSTDNSREIISEYGDRLVTVFKENGGQASALNAGFEASRGDIVFFLDSDDCLSPTAVETVVPCFLDPKVVKVHWPLEEVDESGNPTGYIFPRVSLPSGDFRSAILEGGPTSSASSPTSGNAWRRSFLVGVMPIPEDVDYYKTCADEYLYTLAPVFGTIRALETPQGVYRIHGANIFAARSGLDKLKFEVAGHEHQCRALAATLRRAGVEVNLASWRRNSWFLRVKESIDELSTLIPPGETFLLADNGTWGATELFPRHTPKPFIERDGVCWGPPLDSKTAVSELSHAVWNDVSFLVLAWPTFWWLDHFAGFQQRLASEHKCILRNDRLIVYQIR